MGNFYTDTEQNMSPELILSVVLGYFAVLIAISYFTSRNATEESFFTGDRQSPWYLVAFGMIGASLSGITFISIPGWIGTQNFAYMQMVFGYILGYIVIAYLLMPLYYRLNLTSIYAYLGQRFGVAAHKTGAFFFLISRVLGASFRLFLVVDVLQAFVFDSIGIPFWVTTAGSLLLIWLYTFRAGIKTVVWTDTLQTFFMLLSLGLTVYFILNQQDWTIGESWTALTDKGFTQMFEFSDYKSSLFFPKHFFGGMFVAIAMTGLDQDMMQKNLTCKNDKEARRNMLSFTAILVIVNFIFLFLGGLLYLYLDANGLLIPTKIVGDETVVAADRLFPFVAMEQLPTLAGVTFLIGLIAAAYSSADSALTSLTTSFSLDFLGLDKKEAKNKKSTRLKVHIGFSVLLLFVILLVNATNKTSVIQSMFDFSTYTYGPLIGLFAFGIFTKRTANPIGLVLISIASPVIIYLLALNSPSLLNDYHFGFEKLILNGLLTYLGLWAISKKPTTALP